jgi:hypothetical protein
MAEPRVSVFRRGLWVSVLLTALVVVSSPAIAQAPEDEAVAQIRTSLSQRSLWGRDYPLLIASIAGWVRIGERKITVAPDVVFGDTPYRTREEAETYAKLLAAALVERPATLSSTFASIAEEGRGALTGRVGVRPFNNGDSYRVTVGFGLNFLPILRIAEVQRILGREQAIRREVDDRGGERRPLVFTAYVYAGGAELFQTSNYAPSADQVVRAVFDTSLSFRAIGGTP